MQNKQFKILKSQVPLTLKNNLSLGKTLREGEKKPAFPKDLPPHLVLGTFCTDLIFLQQQPYKVKIIVPT